MLLSRRLSAVLLVGVLAAGLLVGFGKGDEAVAKEPRAAIGKIMIPAVAFTPTNDQWVYAKDGPNLQPAGTGMGMFVAPLSFPAPVVRIRRITLIAHDDSECSITLCLFTFRPLSSGSDHRPTACISTQDGPGRQVVSTTEIRGNRRINTARETPILHAMISSSDHALYGVQVTYSY